MNPISSPGANATRLASSPGANATGLALPTLVACLTPPGRGAIAALGIRGPRAWEILRNLFRTTSANSPKLPAEPELDRVWLGRIGEKDSAPFADQVVVTITQMTPIPWVEVHCHGGVEVVRWLMEILEAQGCQPCSWPDLERGTTFDRWKTAAMLAMTQASTVRTASILLDQYHGAFADALAKIKFVLSKSNFDEAIHLLEELARYADVGRHLTAPWKVAVIGPPNVGKSSLVNALAGFQRSVVASTPGTTRDLVTTLIAVDGWAVELIDTAGLREEAESLEGQGINLARRAAADVDLCLWIMDASEPVIWPDNSLRKNNKIKLIINKIDLPAAWNIPQSAVLPISARTGMGLPELVEALARWLVPDSPPPGTAVPFTSALASQVEEALTLARAGRIQDLNRLFLQLATESA